MTESAEDAPIRVLLVDDHGVVRRGLRGYLELLDDIEVIGEAENGLEGVERCAELSPDVVLMDIVMPQLDGIEAISRIKAAQPQVQVVALTSFIEEEKVLSALEAGAIHGYTSAFTFSAVVLAAAAVAAFALVRRARPDRNGADEVAVDEAAPEALALAAV